MLEFSGVAMVINYFKRAGREGWGQSSMTERGGECSPELDPSQGWREGEGDYYPHFLDGEPESLFSISSAPTK